MRLTPWLLFVGVSSISWCAGLRAQAPAEETIAFLRHGEKPSDDKGQLKAKGLNRALKLPLVLLNLCQRKPDFLYAPLPAKKETAGVEYSYIRPLMTIEPTAIYWDLPVETKFEFKQIRELEDELLSPRFENAVIVVAWEHHLLEQALKELKAKLNATGAPVDEWKSEDFDSVYLLKIRTGAGGRTATLEHAQEGLDGKVNDAFPVIKDATDQ